MAATNTSIFPPADVACLLQKHFSGERAPKKFSRVLGFHHDSQQIIPMDPSKGLRPQGRDDPDYQDVAGDLEVPGIQIAHILAPISAEEQSCPTTASCILGNAEF